MESQATCPSCGYPLVSSPQVPGALYCGQCQRWYAGAQIDAAPPGAPPPPPPPGQWYPQPQPQPAPSAMEGLIPTRNPSALIAYYLGVFSVLPCIGFFLAVPALILGIRGLAYVRRYPQVRGVVHAWIGIVLGAIFTLVWGAASVITIVGMTFGP